MARMDLVVAAGGDGTVATAAGIAVRTSAPLAILPLGTANNIATSLGVSAPAPDLIASWATARRVPFDLGRARARRKMARRRRRGRRTCAGGHRTSAGRAQKTRPKMPPADEVAAAVRTFRDALSISSRAPGRLRSTGNRSRMNFCSLKCSTSARLDRTSSSGRTPSLQTATSTSSLAQECHREELLTYLEHRADGGHAAGAAVSSCPRGRDRRCLELHIDDERVDTCELGRMSIHIEPAAIDGAPVMAAAISLR